MGNMSAATGANAFEWLEFTSFSPKVINLLIEKLLPVWLITPPH